MSTPAVFFDRDGVVNVSPGEGYVMSWEAFHFAEGIMEATKLCRERGYRLVLVTSQQGVAKGEMSQVALDDIHTRMQEALAADGARFDHIEACTHLSGSCTCRKPSPEMIYHAEQLLDLDLSRSILIGDHDRDIQMAINSGIPTTIRVLSHHVPGVIASHVVDSTKRLPAMLERTLEQRR
jgi:D,D-heptose 1,7-bisphosphate phosphatase